MSVAAQSAPQDMLLDRNERLSAAAYIELLSNLTKREVKGRYSQSFFGFACGMTLLTSATNVFYRDVGPVVTIALQLWLFLTPVAYPLSSVPQKYRLFFALNPLTAIIEGTRASLVLDRAPDWPLTGLAAA